MAGKKKNVKHNLRIKAISRWELKSVVLYSRALSSCVKRTGEGAEKKVSLQHWGCIEEKAEPTWPFLPWSMVKNFLKTYVSFAHEMWKITIFSNPSCFYQGATLLRCVRKGVHIEKCVHLPWAHEVLFSDAIFSNGIGAKFLARSWLRSY